MLEKICKEHENEIKEILEALNWCFFEELDQDCFETEVVEPFEYHYDKQFGWDNGASKGVLIFKNFGFVIKIPFLYCDGDELSGAVEGKYDWDYCSQEANRYIKAEAEGLQNIFLETDFIGEVNDHPIYIQPFAEPLDKIGDKQSHRSCSKIDIHIVEDIIEENQYNYINCEWEADIFALYGKRFYKKFKEFIKNNEIHDLRQANVGYVGLKPIILDYAGFDY